MTKISTKKTLTDHKLAPKKRFGQNFLTNNKTAENIVHCASISSRDSIIEVGVGLGALTSPLARKAKEVIGIEIDSGIIRYHETEKKLDANVTLIHDDILKIDFSSLAKRCGKPLKIIANLPYSISNPFIFKLVENCDLLDWVVVMLQKEVAERLMAKPSTKEYGIPTVLLASCAKIERLMLLKPQEFHPQPKIDSLVIRITFSSNSEDIPGVPDYDRSLFTKIVRSSFATRRKTLLNNLSAAQLFANAKEKALNKQCAAIAIQAAGLQPRERAENLKVSDFIRLSNEVEKLLSLQQSE